MASARGSVGKDSSKLPPDPQPNARASRKRVKRDGRPQFQFVTATDPSQFRDEDAKRSVRSQAMIHWRHEDSMLKNKPLEPTVNSFQERPDPLPPSIPATWGPGSTSEHLVKVEQPSQYLTARPEPSDLQHFHGVPVTTSRNQDVIERVDYENRHRDEERQIQVFIETLASCYHISRDLDPSTLLPRFQNPELNTIYLVRECIKAFTTELIHKKWTPSHPHIILSSTLPPSTWLDMHAGCPGDSKRTTMVKAETIKMINARLRNPETRLEDATLMVIVNLLAGEMWSCNEKTLRMHETAAARFVVQRGGMDCLGGNGAIAEVTAACCYQSDIVCESNPPPPFQTWEPFTLAPIDLTDIPESPLFCQKNDFTTINRAMHCSALTYSLLCDMRNLTDLFISHNTKLNTTRIADPETSKRLDSASFDYNMKVTGILERVALLPSADTPGLPTFNDWIYESCRITALIYTAAIVMCVPFSVAADPARNVVLSSSVIQTDSKARGYVLANRLTETLYEVLTRTDTANLWNNMSGVFYWVSAVGAAAARTPTAIDMTQQPELRGEAYAMWVRRCLIMFSTRTVIVVVFKHPIPLIMAQKRLLKVQELIGSYSFRDFANQTSLELSR
ncbi:hypothetical protein P153DRAFT_30916 [Dothidotthia symphoricarpi CBS 119687]|uniref:Transcription factor domain-containing protein n=1 Tax=Dothidotthia symphoricarpi CBS 119687 TaxID=1392245 RepID=A0A6A6ACR8_9PLEO|nr:uncharacterized protein P153DRAFT_30916 [Dothidotthia symphoricarpi CBS 119687]KAF2129053.1 hypothetical protein P153DRAFT_30916 [Dothidotthia symphoricarpi CBS 119687]